MKNKIIVLFCVSFLLGITLFNIIPRYTNIRIDGTVVGKTTTELIADSDIIIKGVVKEQLASKWSNPDFQKGKDIRNVLTSDISIDITKVYKGTPYNDKNINVRIAAGIDTEKKIKITSEGYPDFVPGEEVILFLSKDQSDIVDTSSNYYVLTGMLQGKFNLNKENKVEDEYISSASWNKDKIKPSSFEKLIKDSLDYVKNNPKKTPSKQEIEDNNKKIFGN